MVRVASPAVDGGSRPGDHLEGDVVAPLRAQVVSILVSAGDVVAPHAEVIILEALKMHHAVTVPAGGEVVAVHVSPGMVVQPGQRLLSVVPAEGGAAAGAVTEQRSLDEIRSDLAELRKRLDTTLDAQRPRAVAKRHDRGFRTARENVDDLCDADSFQEYGQLIVAAQRRIRSMDDLIASTPADGLVAGFGTVNADVFGPETARCAVLAYDYTVLAGTQGMFNHKKTDRVLGLAEQWKTPVAFFLRRRRRPAQRYRPARYCRFGPSTFIRLRPTPPAAGGPFASASPRDPVCGQCRVVRKLRYHHCHPSVVYRHGGARDGRSGRPRRVSGRRYRSDRGSRPPMAWST